RAVRMRGLFGQEGRISSLCCPNAGFIRTAGADFFLGLSECGAYSDRRGEFLPWLVRMRGLFGQEGLISTLCCPNAGLIRTGGVDFFLGVSECEAYSDRRGGFLPWLVRMRGLFGQEGWISSLACPNAGLIRTGGRISSLCCPNVGSIRT